MTRSGIFLAALASVTAGDLTLADDVDFAHDVVPILRQHCAECHTGAEAEGGFSFSTERLFREASHVTPGDVESSRLLELIASSDPDEQMPPKEKKRLSADEITTLKDWVRQGARWEPGFQFGAPVWEPPLLPRDVQVPQPAYRGEHPIDGLLRSYGAEYDLVAMKPATDSVFLRRASMDLVGLLPDLNEQQAFHNNPSPAARAEYIDSLLARNHDYAEHWMSFWNDLLRNDYAGTGFIDGGRRQITGWLYTALFENKPYDDFVRELIAPTADSDGFINGIKWRGDVNASQVREIQFAQNVGQVFLGINMKCASCHDSFIDRWTLDESYGLAAVYSERELEIHRCDKPIGRIAKAAWIFPELGTVDADAEQPERLRQLAGLMTDPQNGRLNRTIVNRVWHRMMGHGIVHPVDAMHTQPWDQDLLDYLANELVAHEYDLKHILRLIATSKAYQAVSVPSVDSASTEPFIFRGPVARHLTAEQFVDSVGQLTETNPRRLDAPIPPAVYVGESWADVEPGQWIWGHDHSGSSPGGEVVEFRRTVELPSIPERAFCIIVCDDSYELTINEKVVRQESSFRIDTIDIRSELRSGANEFLVRGTNGGDSPNPAGLYVDIVLIESGRVRKLKSGTEWEASVVAAESPRGWQPALPAEPQDFRGEKFQTQLKDAVVGAILGNIRPVRASMIRSDMLARSLGRPNREQVVTVRPDSLSTLQAIDLANGAILDGTLAEGGRNLLPEVSDRSELVRNTFLRALCREPTEEEQSLGLELLGPEPDAGSIQDLLWTVVMLPEFQFVR